MGSDNAFDRAVDRMTEEVIKPAPDSGIARATLAGKLDEMTRRLADAQAALDELHLKHTSTWESRESWRKAAEDENGKLASAIARAERMEKALQVAKIMALALIREVEALPENTFGIDSDGSDEVPGGMRSWPRRDEILHHLRSDLATIDAALSDAGAQSNG